MEQEIFVLIAGMTFLSLAIKLIFPRIERFVEKPEKPKFYMRSVRYTAVYLLVLVAVGILSARELETVPKYVSIAFWSIYIWIILMGFPNCGAQEILRLFRCKRPANV